MTEKQRSKRERQDNINNRGNAAGIDDFGFVSQRLYSGGAFMSPWIAREVFTIRSGTHIAVVDMNRKSLHLCHIFIVKTSHAPLPTGEGTIADKDKMYAFIETMMPVHAVCNVTPVGDAAGGDANISEHNQYALIFNTYDKVKCNQNGPQSEQINEQSISKRAHDLIVIHNIEDKVAMVHDAIAYLALELCAGVSRSPGPPWGVGSSLDLCRIKEHLQQLRQRVMIKYEMSFDISHTIA